MKIPFTKNTIFRSDDVHNKASKGGVSILNVIMKKLEIKNIESNKNKKNNEKYKFMKASEMKKGGGIQNVILPAGLSGAVSTLALVTAQHYLKNKKGGSKKPKRKTQKRN